MSQENAALPIDPDADANVVAVAPLERTQSRTKPRRQPRYAVVVHNDDYHTFDYVILALGRVFGYGRERGYQLALQIHTSGRTIVWTGTLELAELKRDQLRGFGPDPFASRPVTFPLGVDIEPLPE